MSYETKLEKYDIKGGRSMTREELLNKEVIKVKDIQEAYNCSCFYLL